jgi:hypothetical protein
LASNVISTIPHGPAVINTRPNVETNMSSDLTRNWFEGLGKVSNANSSLIDEFTNQTRVSWEQFSKILQAANAQVTERVIETAIDANGVVTKYKTTIKLNGDLINEFPKDKPDENDIYWKRHTDLVNESLQTRKEIMLKVVETIGTTVRGIVNPINFSQVDIAKIIELIKKA